MKKPEPIDKIDTFFGCLFTLLVLALSVFPGWLFAIFVGAALEIITGLPYDYGFWLAACVGYVVAVVHFMETMGLAPAPQQQSSGSGFLLGFLVGRFFK